MAQLEGAGRLRKALLGTLNMVVGSLGEPTAVGRHEVRRILVVELWNIGDVVLLLPFLTQLRELFPHASVALLARPHARILLEGTGLVDEFLDDASPADNWLSLNPLLGGWRDLWRLRRNLRSRHFDLAFQCRLHVREHLILAMSGARRRIGYAFGEGDRMLTDAMEVGDRHRHKVDDWLRLLEVFDAVPRGDYVMLNVTEDESRSAAEVLRLRGANEADVLVGIHPGASLQEKRWPLGRFAEVATELASRPGVQVVAFADPDGYGAELHEVPGAIGISTTLRELIAYISRCDLLVCNDSGPMHIAGGLGVQTVAVFGSGVARWFAPLGNRHELVSSGSPELAGGIDQVTTARVLEAVHRSLAVTVTRGR